jgi:hypothetical protein
MAALLKLPWQRLKRQLLSGWILQRSLGIRFLVRRVLVRVPDKTRPNGPGESSPGHLRPKADALGQQAPHSCGLKGRESPA